MTDRVAPHGGGRIEVLLSLCLPVLVLAVSPVSRSSAAGDLDCGPPRVLQAVADAWVDESAPSSNLGSDSILKVRSQGPTGNFRALVRFPAPGPAPDGCVVRTAALRLYAAASGEGRTLQALRLGSAWAESTVTWDNQPATEGTASTVASGEAQGYREWRVTELVEQGVPHGLLVRDALESDTGEQAFHGKEKGEHPPQLVIRYAPPPDPVREQLPPQPAAVTCGQEITVSTLMTNNLTNCPGDALVIGDSHLILDLNGHTVDGVGLAAGVRNDGYDKVTVRNGTITDFDYGVQLHAGTTRGLVEDLHLSANQVAAVELFDADGPAGGNTVQRNRLEGNGLGIALVNGTSHASVLDNTVLENAKEGLTLHHSDGNVVERNRFAGGSDRAIELSAASDNVLRTNSIEGSGDGGVDVVSGSHRNLVEDNVLTATGDSGVFIEGSDGNVLVSNVAHGMSDSGIVLASANDSLVRRNDVRFNPTGLELSGSSRNLIEGNDASESSGNAIEIEGGSYTNRIRENVANRGGGNGIVLGDDALLADAQQPGADHANVVANNTANANRGDGIETAKGGHHLVSNTTIGNGGWGILAAAGTTSDGANVARENAEPGQCLGVICMLGHPPPPDTTAPDTQITIGPEERTEATAARFGFTGSDGGGADGPDGGQLRFECALDGDPYTPCVSPVDYPDLTVGEHHFAVRATDPAGNTDPTPATHTWTILDPPPPPDCGPAVTVSANADSWIERANPRRNHGSDTSLLVGRQRSSDVHRALVRFAFPTELPAGCQVESAVLRMYASTSTPGTTLRVSRLARSWSEQTLTWLNQPTTTGPSALTTAGTGWREWAVTQQFQVMLDGANHGFMIHGDDSTRRAEWQLYSRDRAINGPQLVVVFEQID